MCTKAGYIYDEPEPFTSLRNYQCPQCSSGKKRCYSLLPLACAPRCTSMRSTVICLQPKLNQSDVFHMYPHSSGDFCHESSIAILSIPHEQSMQPSATTRMMGPLQLPPPAARGEAASSSKGSLRICPLVSFRFKKYSGPTRGKVDNSRRAVAQRFQEIQTGQGIEECVLASSTMHALRPIWGFLAPWQLSLGHFMGQLSTEVVARQKITIL